MGPRPHVGVLLIKGLPQMLGGPYHRPAGRTSATATAARTQMSGMAVMIVGMARMGCRTHYLALPTKAKTKSIPSLRNSHASPTYCNMSL